MKSVYIVVNSKGCIPIDEFAGKSVAYATKELGKEAARLTNLYGNGTYEMVECEVVEDKQ